MQKLFQLSVVVSLLVVTVHSQKYYCPQSSSPTLIEGQTTGVIISRYEGQSYYGNHMECMWRIVAEQNQRIQLTVLKRDLQWAPSYTSCQSYDFLEILEGDSLSGKYLASVCGSVNGNPFNVISDGNQMYIRFSTTHQNFKDRIGVELQFDVFGTDACPRGWFQVTPGSADCYMIGQRGRVKWGASQRVCSHSNANLASVTDDETYTAILEQGRNKSVGSAWIGLSDLTAEGTYQWLDKLLYSFKRQVSGNGDRMDCVAQDFTTGEWTVHNCDSTELNYVCMRKKDGSTKIYQATPKTEPPEDSGKSDKVLIIVVAVIVSVVLLATLTALSCCYFHRRRRQQTYRDQSAASSVDSVSQPLPPRPSHVPTTPTPATAPPADDFQMRSQLVAPPTYEESKHDPIAPSLY